MNVNPLSAASNADGPATEPSVAKIVAIVLLVAAILLINAFVIG